MLARTALKRVFIASLALALTCVFIEKNKIAAGFFAGAALVLINILALVGAVKDLTRDEPAPWMKRALRSFPVRLLTALLILYGALCLAHVNIISFFAGMTISFAVILVSAVRSKDLFT